MLYNQHILLLALLVSPFVIIGSNFKFSNLEACLVIGGNNFLNQFFSRSNERYMIRSLMNYCFAQGLQKEIPDPEDLVDFGINLGILDFDWKFYDIND